MRNFIMVALCVVSTQICAESQIDPIVSKASVIEEQAIPFFYKHHSCRRGPRGHRGKRGYPGVQGERGRKGDSGLQGTNFATANGRAFLLLNETTPLVNLPSLDPSNPYVVPLNTEDTGSDQGMFTLSGSDAYFTVPTTGKYLINYSIQVFATYSDMSDSISGAVCTAISVTGLHAGRYGFSRIAPVASHVNTTATLDTVANGTGQALVKLDAGEQVRLLILQVPYNTSTKANEPFAFDIISQTPALPNSGAWLSIQKVE